MRLEGRLLRSRGRDGAVCIVLHEFFCIYCILHVEIHHNISLRQSDLQCTPLHYAECPTKYHLQLKSKTCYHMRYTSVLIIVFIVAVPSLVFLSAATPDTRLQYLPRWHPPVLATETSRCVPLATDP